MSSSESKVGRSYRWRILRGQLRHQELLLWTLRRLSFLRFRVGLWIAYQLWSAAQALTAVGNWAEDRATSLHPLSFETHWRQRGEAVNGWQR